MNKNRSLMESQSSEEAAKPSRPNKILRSVKSQNRLKKLNRGVLPKVRSKAHLAGGALKNNDSDSRLMLTMRSLRYSVGGDRLRDNKNTESRINHLVKAKKTHRRNRAEAVGPALGMQDPLVKRKLALRRLKLANIPKNEKTKKFLAGSVNRNPFFGNLTPEQIQLMVQALKPKRVAANVTLIQQGDVGNSFYIVQKGKLKATEYKPKEKTETKVCDFGVGDSFGELALLFDTKREMTVKTMDMCCVWKLDNMSFRQIMAHGEDPDYELIQQQLKLFPILEETQITKRPSQLKFLAENVHHIRLKKGDVIMKKGDVGDIMYLIVKGRVRCTKAGIASSGNVLGGIRAGRKAGHGQKKLNQSNGITPFQGTSLHHQSVEYTPGDYFGEGVMLKRFMIEKDCEEIDVPELRKKFLKKNFNKWKRAANVFAVKDCEFFVLDYEIFKKLARENAEDFFDTIRHNHGIRMLRASPFINNLRKQYREFLLENLEILTYKHNEIIIKREENEKILFLVVEGRVEVVKDCERKDKEKLSTIHVGQSFGEKFFFTRKAYPFDVVARGKTKIFAMTYLIFSEIFGKKLTLKDICKTGNTEIDELLTLDFTRFSIAGIGENLNLASMLRPEQISEVKKRMSSHIIAKLSDNLDFDNRNSVLNRQSKRRTTSVRGTNKEESAQIGDVIEYKLAKVKSERMKSLQILRQSKKRSTVATKTTKAKHSDILFRKYEVEGAIGMGTFGMVKLIKTKDPNGRKTRRFALKVLSVAKIIKMGQQSSVINEKTILSEVKHPLVLRYFDSFKDHENLYIMTEALPGGELFEIIHSYRKKKDFMPDEHAVFYAACLVETFCYLHEHDILYRDTKPENIMIDEKGYTRLVDFGFAKKVKFKTFTRCGTAEYFAPELISRLGYNKSVDIWGLGILTYEMMTGFSPFYSDNHIEMIDFIMNEDPDFGNDFPDDAVDFIERLLEKEPNYRLGMSLNDPDEIKNHQFFDSINWDALVKRQIPAPRVPKKKKPRIRSEEELRLRLEEESDSRTSYEAALKERDYQGWFQEF